MHAEPTRVIAAVDGSAHSAAALAWAAADARLRQAELLVVTVCGRDILRAGQAGRPPGAAARDQDCRDMQSGMLRAVPGGAPRPVRAQLLHGDPAAVLTGTATGSDVLVVGTRGRSRLRTLLLGSVAQGCAERARCPVVVVSSPPRAPAGRPASHGPVIAGVDASDEGRAALRFAAAEAALRDARLVAVHAVYPDYAASEPGSRSGAAEEQDMLSPLSSARARLGTLLRRELAGSGMTAQPIAVYGTPEQVLLTWAESAALVVVGTRGTGRLHAALLGSVSTSLLQHSQCPVAVVPSPPPPGPLPASASEPGRLPAE